MFDQKEYMRRWRAEHREQILASQRRRYASNPEPIREGNRYRYYADLETSRAYAREQAKRWRAANPEADRAKKRKWRQENPDAARASERAWFERKWATDPESIRATRRRSVSARRSRLAGALREPWTHDEILNRDEWMCRVETCLCPEGRSIDPAVGRNTRWGASVDHIVPLARGGADAPLNLQAAHFACNAGKRDKVAS